MLLPQPKAASLGSWASPDKHQIKKRGMNKGLAWIPSGILGSDWKLPPEQTTLWTAKKLGRMANKLSDLVGKGSQRHSSYKLYLQKLHLDGISIVWHILQNVAQFRLIDSSIQIVMRMKFLSKEDLNNIANGFCWRFCLTRKLSEQVSHNATSIKFRDNATQ